MSNKPVDAATFYAANKADEKQYVSLMVSRPGTEADKDPVFGLQPEVITEKLTPQNEKSGTLVRTPFSPVMTGIVLKEETTFAFKAGNYTAPAGYLLYVNPRDEDGFTVAPMGYDIRPVDPAAKPAEIVLDVQKSKGPKGPRC